MIQYNSNRKGKLVKTKSGNIGKTINGEKAVNGKIKVYLDNGKKILCDPLNLEIIGFYD